jgi:PilZ domain
LLESHKAPVSSLESPTMISTGGDVSVVAIIEQITATECRLRSVTARAVGEIVEFAFAVPGASQTHLRGKIVSFTQVGPRYVFKISLDTSAAQAEAIAASLEVAKARAQRQSHDTPTGNGLTRSSVRVPVDCAVSYCKAGEVASRNARATNLSAGGILMNCADDLNVGGSYELRFSLDGVRIAVHGRVVAHQERSPNYNIAFHDVGEETRAAITHFVASRV